MARKSRKRQTVTLPHLHSETAGLSGKLVLLEKLARNQDERQHGKTHTADIGADASDHTEDVPQQHAAEEGCREQG